MKKRRKGEGNGFRIFNDHFLGSGDWRLESLVACTKLGNQAPRWACPRHVSCSIHSPYAQATWNFGLNCSLAVRPRQKWTTTLYRLISATLNRWNTRTELRTTDTSTESGIGSCSTGSPTAQLIQKHTDLVASWASTHNIAQGRHASKSMIIRSYGGVCLKKRSHGGARIQNIHDKIIRYAEPFHDQHFFRKELNVFTIWSVTCAESWKWMSQQLTSKQNKKTIPYQHGLNNTLSEVKGNKFGYMILLMFLEFPIHMRWYQMEPPSCKEMNIFNVNEHNRFHKVI